MQRVLGKFGILQVARTGKISLKRGEQLLEMGGWGDGLSSSRPPKADGPPKVKSQPGGQQEGSDVYAVDSNQKGGLLWPPSPPPPPLSPPTSSPLMHFTECVYTVLVYPFLQPEWCVIGSNGDPLGPGLGEDTPTALLISSIGGAFPPLNSTPPPPPPPRPLLCVE